MPKPFHRIHLFAKYNNNQDLQVKETLDLVIKILQKQACSLRIEALSAKLLPEEQLPLIDYTELGLDTDLVIVIGGDGSILKAARSSVHHQVPILGINRGRLGFLTDLSPNSLNSALLPIINGHYQVEQRTLLQGQVWREKTLHYQQLALNDVVLYTGGLARMIEFEVFIDEHFVFKQRSDGLITATPTGSTAYALSAGGPILYPDLKAWILVPMMAHTLASRPLVIADHSKLRLSLTENLMPAPKLSFDGQLHTDLAPQDDIVIERAPHTLDLIHPLEHNYYATLRQKLGWNINWTSDRWSS